MYIPNLSVLCFFICLSYFIFYCALLLFCAQAWHGKTLSSRNDPIFFCSLHWRNLSLYNKITTHFKLIRFWWKNVITFRGKVYSNFFKFVQQLLSVEWCSAASSFCGVLLCCSRGSGHLKTHTHTHTHTPVHPCDPLIRAPSLLTPTEHYVANTIPARLMIINNSW